MPSILVPRAGLGNERQVDWIRQLAEALDVVASGHTRSGGEVTLTANDTTTTVTNPFVANGCHVGLTPTTANAAAELGAGGCYVSARSGGVSFTITHANNAQTDRTFTYEIRVL